MVYFLDSSQIVFPSPEDADESGLVAIGGKLTPRWLLAAYSKGIFPWFSYDDEPILWFSLDPRMLMHVAEFRCSKSLQRTLRSHRYEVRIDTCFEQVIRSCASTAREGQDGTWITNNMIRAYVLLHKMGLAHSFETFVDNELVGGLYGVSLGKMFFGESMFHRATDASKVAFSRLVDFASLHNMWYIDAQQPTSHLASLGAKPVERKLFLEKLNESNGFPTMEGDWSTNTVVLLIGGNSGDRQAILVEAISMIESEVGRVVSKSKLYETEPWGFDAEQDFLNQAVVVDTALDARTVLARVLAIEQKLGRVRPQNATGYSSRPIDIDIIYYNGDIIEESNLVVPHPRMHLRRFVLLPLSDVIPNFFHPKLRKTTLQLLAMCNDKGEVKEFDGGVNG